MNPMGSRAHAWIGLWILTGLIVMGINGYMLLSLLDEPLAGYSIQVHNANRAFRQYRMLLQAETEKIASGMDLLANRFAPETPEEEPAVVQPVQDPPPTVKKKKPPPPVALPTLSGIVNRLSEDGTIQWLALMNGSVWSQGDQLGQLTVQHIGSRGIVLVSGDRSWFVKAPERSYSLAVQ